MPETVNDVYSALHDLRELINAIFDVDPFARFGQAPMVVPGTSDAIRIGLAGSLRRIKTRIEESMVSHRLDVLRWLLAEAEHG